MADLSVPIPAVDKLEREELLALVMIVSAGRIGDLDIATARWEAASLRFEQKSEAVAAALRDYTDARAHLDKAMAEGRSTKAATRAVDAALAAYVRADAAASAAFNRLKRRLGDLQTIRAGGKSR